MMADNKREREEREEREREEREGIVSTGLSISLKGT